MIIINGVSIDNCASSHRVNRLLERRKFVCHHPFPIYALCHILYCTPHMSYSLLSVCILCCMQCIVYCVAYRHISYAMLYIDGCPHQRCSPGMPNGVPWCLCDHPLTLALIDALVLMNKRKFKLSLNMVSNYFYDFSDVTFSNSSLIEEKWSLPQPNNI